MGCDYQLWHGDCLEEMSRIEAGSVDMILADLPYGTTACKWDIVIPFEPLWKQYKRVIKKNGAIVLTASQPFTSLLVMSNLEWFRYEWNWRKNKSANFQSAKCQPRKTHENILVFSRATANPNSINSMIYNPQMGIGKLVKSNMGQTESNHMSQIKQGGTYKIISSPNYDGTLRFPESTISFDLPVNKIHPSQKPISLLSYLIKTYTNEGETVLDNTCGSGSTLEAAMRNNRRSIGIEKDAGYFDVATQRLARVAAELRGELNHLPMFAEAR